MIKVTQKELLLIRDFVESNCGIVLDDSKSYLVESRLGPILPEIGASNYLELIVSATKDRSDKLKHKIIDCITTNETYFFRDQKPFELLAHKLIPDVLEKQLNQTKIKLRIWSAAASTGQEVYSVAMVIKELLGKVTDHDIRILGTDISKNALEIASRGLYGKIELSRGLTGARLKKHFTAKEPLWQVNDDLRAVAQFKPTNLLTGATLIPIQDIILCRNVAFYFSKENKQRLFQNLAKKLETGGILVIGSTENLVGMDLPFERKDFHGNIYYQKK
ncbi:MAG: protein-glutamate O-methyltransferase CheR [Deltaproteobacteria bacterium]|nr:protein-glutamate O-methyltransferase CheR [Deltaproteobacteria bacterium]MBN2674201.1 protein-glutamate O-methyltransferase CheR [Deltaproteobacteria bacterium]